MSDGVEGGGLDIIFPVRGGILKYYVPIDGLPQDGGRATKTHGNLDISVFKRTISPPLGLNLVSNFHSFWKLFSIIFQNGGQKGDCY